MAGYSNNVQVFLVRHAEAVDETLELRDPHRHLTEQGRTQAKSLGDRLRWHDCEPTHIWTSPLVRAVQTAELLAVGLQSTKPVTAIMALAPLVATYRRCGLSAYTDADRICLSGQPITGVSAVAVGDCAVVVANFVPWGIEFIELLRHRVEAQYGWLFDTAWPTQAEHSGMHGTRLPEAAGES